MNYLLLFTIIYNVHVTMGHRGIRNTLDEIKTKYINVTEKQIKLFISQCHECKVKCAKPKNSSELVVKPITSNDFNTRGQVDLNDMQSCPDGELKFILNYQDHFRKLCILKSLKTKIVSEIAYHLLDIFTTTGAPAILQSDSSRESTAEIIEESSSMWKDLKVFIERLDCANNGWTSLFIHIFMFRLLLIFLRSCFMETRNTSLLVARNSSLRSMVSFLVLSAICNMIVPEDHNTFL